MDMRQSKLHEAGMQRMAALMAVFAFVAVQFVQWKIGHIGSFVLSFQKVLALLLLLPAALVVRKIRVPRWWGVFYVAQLAALSGAAIAGKCPVSQALAADISLTMGFLAALVVVSSLDSQSSGNKLMLGRIWILLAVLSALICVFQANELVPLWTVGKEFLHGREALGNLHLLRAVGFRFDPNLEAAVLVFGVGFAIAMIRPGILSIIVLMVLTLGVFFTFSRLGMVLVIVLFGLIPIVHRRRLRLSLGAAVGIVLVMSIVLCGSVLGLAQLAGGGKYGEYVDHRLAESVHSGRALMSDTPGELKSARLSSAESRFLLAYYGVKVFWDNPWVGVGPFSVPVAIQRASGTDNPALKNVAHNSVIQMLATGGVFGLFAVLAYAYALLRYVLCTWKQGRSRLWWAVALVSSAFIFESMFLSLTLTSLYWLPLILGEMLLGKRAPVHQEARTGA